MTRDRVPPVARRQLLARLQERLPEIEAAVYAAVRSVDPGPTADDPKYLAGVRAAVSESVEFRLAGIESGPEAWLLPIPLAAMAQARRAARNEVGLDTLFRRLAAGDRKLGEFILDGAESLPPQALREILVEQGRQMDRLMASVAVEYGEEWEQRRRLPKAVHSERIKQLLANEGAVNLAELNYIFDCWHLGLIAKGTNAAEVVRRLASRLDRELLVSGEDEGVIWAWLGGRRPLSPDDVERAVVEDGLDAVEIAIGEPRQGIDGWRLTHHEAQAALSVMLCRPQTLTRGGSVPLLAAMLREPLLGQSLLETYMRPLADDDGRATLRRTLTTYISTGFNAASTSEALGIDRSTVKRHLSKIEERLRRPLHTCHAELKVALEFMELDDRHHQSR